MRTLIMSGRNIHLLLQLVSSKLLLRVGKGGSQIRVGPAESAKRVVESFCQVGKTKKAIYGSDSLHLSCHQDKS